MKMIIRLTGLVIVATCSLIACSASRIGDLGFMAGTWQVEGKDQYEVWEPAEGGQLDGLGYKLVDGEKVILERLSIKSRNSQVVYEATVADQNDGATVPFTLNLTVKDWFIFENENHDFPKKIMYQKTSANELLVRVLGAEDKGFSYRLLRQDG